MEMADNGPQMLIKPRYPLWVISGHSANFMSALPPKSGHGLWPRRRSAEGTVCDVAHFGSALWALNKKTENSLTTWGRPMKKQILIVTAAALTSAVVILSGTSAATAKQRPQYQVADFPVSPHQMSVLQLSARIKEQQRLSGQLTMDASRGAVVRDFGIAGQSGT
jgi:hypothetical protein